MTIGFHALTRWLAASIVAALLVTSSRAADFYLGTFDDMPSYNLINSYTDPGRTGWYDFSNLNTVANTSTTVGVTSGTQSLAWQPGAVGFNQGLAYKVQIAPLTVDQRTAIVQAFLANTHFAMNVTWDRNEWVAQHNGDIATNNFSQIGSLVINYGPGGNFASQGAPDVDTGNSNFKGGWDPVNYTDATHTRTIMWDYSEIKPQIQALVDAGTTNGTNGWLEFIISTNAGDYNYPITYYYDTLRFTTPVAGVQGDFNNNGTVDAADYVLWRNGGPLANEVTDAGIVSAADYNDWRARFGNIAGAGSGLQSGGVPEPASCVLMLLAGVLASFRRVQR
jgi:hypothetical protein